MQELLKQDCPFWYADEGQNEIVSMKATQLESTCHLGWVHANRSAQQHFSAKVLELQHESQDLH